MQVAPACPHTKLLYPMCRRVVEVEQVGESKILMWHTTFSTEVRVVEDDSDPARLKTEFELVRSVGDMTQSIADTFQNHLACAALIQVYSPFNFTS